MAVLAIREDSAPPPADERLRRLSVTLDELAAAVCERDDGALARRPDAHNWSATEIVCHLRDVEELFLTRFMTMLAMDEPKILAFNAAPADLAAWGIGSAVGNRSIPTGGPTSASTGATTRAKRSLRSRSVAARRWCC